MCEDRDDIGRFEAAGEVGVDIRKDDFSMFLDFGRGERFIGH